MPPTPLLRRPLLSLSSPNSRDEHPQPEPTRELALTPASLTLPTPLFIPSASIVYTSQTPYSPPFTPPTLVPSSSTLCDLDAQAFPCTPTTPLFSPITEQDTLDPFDASYALPSDPSSGNNNSSKLDLYAPHIHVVSGQPISPFPPKVTSMTNEPRLTRPISGHGHPKRKPHLTCRAKSDRILTARKGKSTNANVYSSHFPPQHALDGQFVKQYMPGAEIGVGAFGFVVTATHRMLGREVAVKFIERGKVPPWGWSMDLELGYVPTEVMLLKALDHPGIIKFLDLFRDEIYFYLVQELHGSPWRGEVPADTEAIANQEDPNSPTASLWGRCDEIPATLAIGSPHTSSQHVRLQVRGSEDMSFHPTEPSEFPFPRFPPSPSSPPSLSPSVPFAISHPLPPHTSSRPNMPRRLSHDLFECIEEHSRLSEPQARHVFAQVVDVIYYLHSAGVTHRDIKDENILVDRAFRVKIIDFGSASCVDPSRPGPRPWYRQYRGTIAYAPAEIFKGNKLHQAEPADIWALGILLSCLICGRRPFATAEDAMKGRVSLHRCKVRDDGEPPSASHPGNSVSRKCWDLLKCCLDPDPQSRANIAEIRAHPWVQDTLVAA